MQSIIYTWPVNYRN